MKELNKWRQDERVIVYIDETYFDFRKNSRIGEEGKLLQDKKLYALESSVLCQ